MKRKILFIDGSAGGGSGSVLCADTGLRTAGIDVFAGKQGRGYLYETGWKNALTLFLKRTAVQSWNGSCFELKQHVPRNWTAGRRACEYR